MSNYVMWDRFGQQQQQQSMYDWQLYKQSSTSNNTWIGGWQQSGIFQLQAAYPQVDKPVAPVEKPSPPLPKPSELSPSLAWLDRRVNEIRVAL